MAYEYNPNSTRFDIQNPHAVENIFITICGAVCFVAAIVALVEARTIFFEHDAVRFAKSIAAAVSLLALVISYAYRGMRQVRFFFGRGQPADLVPSLSGDAVGYRAADSTASSRQIADAAVLRETLQQNAITYRVPHGPIDTLLYWLVRDLVYSPRLTQELVQAQFRNILAIAFVLVLFTVSLLGIRNPGAIGWIGCFYFILTNAVVLRPLAGARFAQASFSERTVIGFIALAVVAPVIIASVVPPGGYALAQVIDIVPVTFIILVVALVVTALVFRAGIANTVKPTQIAIAPHLETPSVNVTPAEVYSELARELQRLWQEQVPNRKYMRRLPDVSERQGPFSADVIEETQPMPVDVEPLTLGGAIALPTTRWLVVVDALCTLLTIVGAALVVLGASEHAAYNALVTGAAVVVVGAFGMRSANTFWRRFAFTSRIYWVDWSGNYARAATKIGALLNDRVHTEREVITVESMTLRVWVAEIDSIAFNTDRDRDLVAIRGLPDEAQRLGRWLAAFVQNQGSVIAPTSPVDAARLDAINAINSPGGGPTPTPLADLPTAPMQVIGGARVTGSRFCPACGSPAASAAAAYCSGCGTRLS